MMELVRKRGGFTLMELMIVVVILAILAVVAVFSYKKYIRKARTQEAVSLTADIKLKQSQFYSSYGSYVSTDPGAMTDCQTATGYWPPTLPGGDSVPWNVDCKTADPASAEGRFCLLGFRPTSEVFFQYKTVGWAPTATGVGVNEDKPLAAQIPEDAWIAAGSPRWYYVCARTHWTASNRPSDHMYIQDSVILNQPVITDPTYN